MSILSAIMEQLSTLFDVCFTEFEVRSLRLKSFMLVSTSVFEHDLFVHSGYLHHIHTFIKHP